MHKLRIRMVATQIAIHAAAKAKPIINNKLPLNSATPLLLGVAFVSELEPVPEEGGEEEDDGAPDEVVVVVEAEVVGLESVELEPAPASLKIFASGESGKIREIFTGAIGGFGINVASRGHLQGQSGVDRESPGGVSALLDENTQAFGLGALHFLGVVAALLGWLLS